MGAERPILFSEVTERDAQIVVRTAADSADRRLAWATVPDSRAPHPTTGLRITVATDRCWYTDRAFCFAFDAHKYLILSTLGVAWAAAAGFAAHGLLVARARAPCPTAARASSRSVAIGVPLVGIGSMAPCLACYDFEAVRTRSGTRSG